MRYAQAGCARRNWRADWRVKTGARMIKFLGSVVGVIFLIGLAVVIGLLVLIF